MSIFGLEHLTYLQEILVVSCVDLPLSLIKVLDIDVGLKMCLQPWEHDMWVAL